jgi:DNA polymerase
MRTIYLDLETYSETPITHGTWAYAENAEILLLAYAWDDDDEVQVVEFPTPGMMQSLIDAADQIVIHNSHFDRTVLSFSQVRVPVERIYDTLAVGLLHSLPGALDKQCEVLGVPLDKAKDKAGKKLIQLFCKPQAKTRKLRRATKETHPAEWEAFKEYARMDIVAMREVYKRQPKVNWTDAEKAVWRLDQAINDRGIQIDMDLAHAALRAAKEAGQRLAVESALMTNGAVPSATQRDALINYLRDTMGLEIDDLRKGTLGALLKTDVPDDVRELLEVRLQAAATSPAKYRVLVNGTSSDRRLRGTMQYAGASRTARWGGRLFQPQNLPRPTLKQPQIDTGIEAMKVGVETVFYDDVMELCASAVRGSIVAAPGCKLVVADLSNIEGRVLAWLAGEQWKLDAFREFDAGVGHDIYKITAGGILGKDPGDVTKDERQVSGKVPELACGYQGSVGAFAAMGAIYGVNLPEPKVLEIVKAWRAKHKATVKFWYDCERAARNAISNPGEVYRASSIAFRRSGGWLRARLPSGRYLCYPSPQVDEDGRLSYMGTNQYTRRWERLDTYGGKLVENLTQATARDVLAAGLLAAEAAGYGPVLHVHDEIICETPDDPAFSAEGLAALMSQGTQWSVGLPLAAAGFETYRYQKGD